MPSGSSASGVESGRRGRVRDSEDQRHCSLPSGGGPGAPALLRAPVPTRLRRGSTRAFVHREHHYARMQPADLSPTGPCGPLPDDPTQRWTQPSRRIQLRQATSGEISGDFAARLHLRMDVRREPAGLHRLTAGDSGQRCPLQARVCQRALARRRQAYFTSSCVSGSRSGRCFTSPPKNSVILARPSWSPP